MITEVKRNMLGIRTVVKWTDSITCKCKSLCSLLRPPPPHLSHPLRVSLLPLSLLLPPLYSPLALTLLSLLLPLSPLFFLLLLLLPSFPFSSSYSSPYSTDDLSAVFFDWHFKNKSTRSLLGIFNFKNHKV